MKAHVRTRLVNSSESRKKMYLTKFNIDKRQTSMSHSGIRSEILAIVCKFCNKIFCFALSGKWGL